MNESGIAVSALSHYYDVSSDNIWVLHDDLDIDIGTFKIAFNRGDAGNNGIRSISQRLGTQEYYRWRIGIRGTAHSIFGAIRKSFVLAAFKKGDAESVNALYPAIKDSLELALYKDPAAAMNKYNQS